MAADLGMEPVHVSGHLHALWHNCLEQQEDGDLSKWPAHLIAQMAMVKGDAKTFVEALYKHGWIDQDTHLLHDWLDYAGKFLLWKYRRRHHDKLKAIWVKHGKRYGKRMGQVRDTVPQRSHTTNLTNLTNLTRPTKPTVSPQAVNIALRLSERIGENLPHRTPPTKAQLKAWAAEADKMHRIDGHDWELIGQVLDWSQRDPFWKANVLSMATFRKHWDRLLAKMQLGSAAKVQPHGGFAFPNPNERIARALRQGLEES